MKNTAFSNIESDLSTPVEPVARKRAKKTHDPDSELLKNEVMTFCSKKDVCRSLSNFSDHEIEIRMRYYTTGEHCFHGEKFTRLGYLQDCSEERRIMLLNHGLKFQKHMLNDGFRSAADSKKKGSKSGFHLYPNELQAWSVISDDVQRKICEYKIQHYPDVRSDLETNRNKILVHSALRCSEAKVRDCIWEGKAVVEDGQIKVLGKNKLGTIWKETFLKSEQDNK